VNTFPGLKEVPEFFIYFLSQKLQVEMEKFLDNLKSKLTSS
jgi:hypothetical protein